MGGWSQHGGTRRAGWGAWGGELGGLVGGQWGELGGRWSGQSPPRRLVSLGLKPSRHMAVDGAWSAWSPWSRCDRTCGGGRSIRSRSCTRPPPKNGGQPCPGERHHLRLCNPQPCGTARGVGGLGGPGGTWESMGCTRGFEGAQGTQGAWGDLGGHRGWQGAWGGTWGDLGRHGGLGGAWRAAGGSGLTGMLMAVLCRGGLPARHGAGGLCQPLPAALPGPAGGSGLRAGRALPARLPLPQR